jgi:membrane protein
VVAIAFVTLLGMVLAAGRPTRLGQPPSPESPDDGVGHCADRPTHIPPRGWWQITKRVVRQINQHRIMTEAAGVTFYALLAIFPALAAMVSLYGLFADPATVSDHLNAIAGFVPGGGMDIISDQVKRLAANGKSSLGVGLAIGLATSLWSSNAAMKALFDSLNIVYGEHERRAYVRLTLLSLGLTLGAIIFILLALAAVVALPVALNLVGLGSAADLTLRLGRWPALMAVIILFLSVVYRFGPSRTAARWRWVSPGSLFAAIGWVLVSAGFSWYVTNFGSYNKTYGSLGAAIGFMTWIWLSAIVVLVGAELNAEAEHQTAVDTTVSGRPLGARGATKADTVAA